MDAIRHLVFVGEDHPQRTIHDYLSFMLKSPINWSQILVFKVWLPKFRETSLRPPPKKKAHHTSLRRTGTRFEASSVHIERIVYSLYTQAFPIGENLSNFGWSNQTFQENPTSKTHPIQQLGLLDKERTKSFRVPEMTFKEHTRSLAMAQCNRPHYNFVFSGL